MLTKQIDTQTAVLIINSAGQVSSVNEAFLHLLDYPESSLLNQKFSALFAPLRSSGKRTFNLIKAVNNNLPANTFYLNAIKSDKTDIPVELICVKITYGEDDYYICTVKNIETSEMNQDIADLMRHITIMAVTADDEKQIAPSICNSLVDILDLDSVWIGTKEPNGDLHINATAGHSIANITVGKTIPWTSISKELPNAAFSMQHGQTSIRLIGEENIPFYDKAIYYSADMNELLEANQQQKPTSKISSPQQTKKKMTSSSPTFSNQIVTIPLLFCKDAVGVIELRTRNGILKNELREALESIAEQIALILKMAIDTQHMNLLSAAISSAANGVFITDIEGNIIWNNIAFSAMSGYSNEELSQANIHILKSGQHTPFFFKDFWKTIKSGKRWSGEVINRDKFGALYTVQQTVSPITSKDGRITHFVVIHDDLTAKKDAEGLLNQMKNYDPLTKLPNRELFEASLQQKIEALKAGGTNDKIAVFFIDISNFNVINDTMGHSVGDKILRDLADNLTYMTSSNDILSRFGGDNFALATQIRNNEDASMIAGKILSSITEPKEIDGKELILGSYIGIATYPDDSNSAAKLLNFADMAMHKAAFLNNNSFYFFSHKINEEAENRLNLERDLRKALANKEFILNYQPQIDLRTNTISGWEALIRWYHPVLGLVPPVNFIPIAEDSGLILPIGEWVLTEALRQWRKWREMGLPNAIMAVNLSAVQFKQSDLVYFVEKSLIETGVTPENLELELTESVVMQNAELANEALRKISDIGVKIAIDDFGTGYSSLSYLRRFPVDKLKIDRSFVLDLEQDSDNVRITNAIIQLGHILGLEVIAEGVEDKRQLNTLKSNGCDAIQGYLFGKPMNPEDIPKYVKDKQYLLKK